METEIDQGNIINDTKNQEFSNTQQSSQSIQHEDSETLKQQLKEKLQDQIKQNSDSPDKIIEDQNHLQGKEEEKEDIKQEQKLERKNSTHEKKDKKEKSKKSKKDSQKSKKRNKDRKSRRSDSESTSRSRSRHKKHSSKRSRSRSRHNKRHSKRRSRSNSRDRYNEKKRRNRSRERRSRHKSRSKSSRTRSPSQDRDRSRSKKKQVKERRSRTRSPVKIIRRYACPTLEMGEPQKLWDGFQWVVKTNTQGYINPELQQQTLKLRKVQVTNLPIYLGLTQTDVQVLMTKYMMENYLHDNENLHPIRGCSLAPSSNSAILELSSVEETNRLVKLDSNQSFLMADTSSLTSTSQINAQANTQQTAQAQAAALAAIEMIGSKNQTTNFQLGLSITPPSQVIKISNILMPEKISQLTEKMFDDINEDIKSELLKYGTVMESFIIKPFQITIGAQAGTVFAQYQYIEEATCAYENINGRVYAGNELKCVYLNVETYQKFFLPQSKVKRAIAIKK